MYRWPVRLPLSSSNGATPTKAASARRSSRPSSGSQAMRAAIVTGPTPGTVSSRAASAANCGCAAMALAIKAIELFDRSRDRLQSRRQGPRRTFRAGGDLVLQRSLMIHQGLPGRDEARQMLALGIEGNLASLRGREHGAKLSNH